MRGFPDFLYQADPKAIAGSLIEYRRYRAAATNAAAAVAVNLFLDMPLDRVLLITTLSVQTQSAAPQVLLQSLLRHLDTGGINTYFDFECPVPTGTQRDAKTLVLDYLVIPKRGVTDILSLTCDFSAGAVNNSVILSAAGWLLPRGNIQS